MTRCLNCGAECGCGQPDCDSRTAACSPSCKGAPEHCGKCPPWQCPDCHQTSSPTQLCPCWTPLEGMALADLKAIFAASDMGLTLAPEGEQP